MWWTFACAGPGIEEVDTAAAAPPARVDDLAPATDAGSARPLDEADTSPAGCTVASDYDDDADGVIDRWTVVDFDDAGHWQAESLDDGTYTGSFIASWEGGCLVREEGALVDDDGDDWAVTVTRDCGEHDEVTRETEVWAETRQDGGSVVYGDTTRWTWTWDADRYVEVAWTSNDGETTHHQTWTWTDDLGPDSADVDLLSDGVIDETWAWTWEADGDLRSETEDGVTTTWRRDRRDRLIESDEGGEVFVTWTFDTPASDHPRRATTERADGVPVAFVTYTWDCAPAP